MSAEPDPLPTTCAKCGESFDGILFMCDRLSLADGPDKPVKAWCERCFDEATHCVEEHGEGCETAVWL